jgi:hypothetical protein
LICSKHHKLLHEGGYTIRKNFEGKWSFRTGNGKVIPESPMFRVDYYENHSGRPSGVMDLKRITKNILFVIRYLFMLLGSQI